MKTIEKMINELHHVVFSTVIARKDYRNAVKSKSENRNYQYQTYRGYFDNSVFLAKVIIHVFNATPDYINTELKKSFDYLENNEEYGKDYQSIIEEFYICLDIVAKHEKKHKE